ncbi:MAG: BBP7 family outer membrane beta-barrel protein [Planctomycetaceae bacterium]|nr:BBP7 family outer membrane beta-barrel protein [Planctomycetaceae bacterium]
MLARSLLAGPRALPYCRTAAIGATALLATVLLGGTLAKAQTDVGAVAPWQVPPEMRSHGDAPRAAQSGHDQSPGEIAEAAAPCDGGCELGDCGGCVTRCPDWLWFRGDYLMWWGKSVHLPALAASDLAGTNTIFGAQTVDQGIHSGGRFSLGGWLTDCQQSGVEFNYLFLGDQTTRFTQNSTDNPILTRPFFSAQSFATATVVVANPGLQSGSIVTGVSSELQSAEVLYRQVMFAEGTEQIDGLVGYRYGRLAEGLAINSSTTIIDNVPPFANGTVVAVSDLFDAINEFNGGEIGVSAKSRHCRWSLEVLGKLALGSMQSRLNVSGTTTTTPPTGSPAVANGGFLTLPTNSGAFERTNFAVMPELGLNLSYDITCRVKATCGYTFLYMSQVVRPADQVDTNLNPTQFSGGKLTGFPTPEPRFVMSDYWAQGLTFGLECRF